MVRLVDLLPMDFLSNDIKLYVKERLVYEDGGLAKRYKAFSSYADYIVDDISANNREVHIYLRRN